MIENKNGRTISRRTVAEERALLEKEMAALNEEEREFLRAALKEALDEEEPAPGEMKLLERLNKEEYKTTPVDMKTFVMDPQYLGNTCDSLYPKLLADLTELFEGGYHECIWTGSIGYGKTFTASIGVCRVLYELSCMKDPHSSFGLAKGSNISIVALSVSEMLATKVVFDNIAAKIDASPYFRENFPFEKTKKELRFPGNLLVASRASTDTSALGLNTISAFIDESNFMPKAPKGQNQAMQGVDRAEQIYNTLKRRMKSRFEKFGRLPGMLFVVSSKSTQDDFTAKRVRESRVDPTVFVRDYALWDVKPEDYYQQKSFYALGGNDQTPSRILDEGEEKNFENGGLPEGCVMVKVPADFRTDFERDLEGSLRDIAGVATVAISPFIQRREKIVEAVDKTREHPFTTEVLEGGKGGMFNWEAMVKMAKTREYGMQTQKMTPILNPRAPRHIHVDPSLRNDALGFCMAHVAGWKDVIRRGEDNQQFVERAPVYIVDFVLRVVPPTGGEIILGDIRRMIYDLAAHGYLITSVSMDQFQSADSLQQLSQKGYNAQLISVDVTPDPYDNVKMALYENRLFFYEYAPLMDELKVLEQKWDARKKRKIDHPPRKSKDVADALAGCLWTLQLNAPKALPLIPQKGQATRAGGEAWLAEQQHAIAAGQSGASHNQDVRDFASLPPIMFGNNDEDDWGKGGGGWGSL